MTVWDLITKLQEISWGDMNMNVTIGYYDTERVANPYKKFGIEIIDWAVWLDLSGDWIKRKWCTNPQIFICFEQ